MREKPGKKVPTFQVLVQSAQSSPGIASNHCYNVATSAGACLFRSCQLLENLPLSPTLAVLQQGSTQETRKVDDETTDWQWREALTCCSSLACSKSEFSVARELEKQVFKIISQL